MYFNYFIEEGKQLILRRMEKKQESGPAWGNVAIGNNEINSITSLSETSSVSYFMGL